MTAADGRVVGTTKIAGDGPATDRLNLVLVAEGYRQAELTSFARHARALADTLFATGPFDQARDAINVFRIDVASKQSGADDPRTCPDHSTGSGATPATFFDASFCNDGIRRLLLVDDDTVLQVVGREVPEWHAILVVVNTDLWGGAGGSVGTTSVTNGWEGIAIHELGHTLFDLADEYESWRGCGIDTDHDHYGSTEEPWEANITASSDRATIKWRDLIAAGTAVPTTSNPECTECDRQPSPVGSGVVGAFEGAGYFHCGLYRPEFACMMRFAGTPFCAVCRRAILARLAQFLDDAGQKRRPAAARQPPG